MLPDGWESTQLRKLISSLEGGVSVNSEGRTSKFNELGVLKVSAVSTGVFRPQEYKAIIKEEFSLARVSPKSDRIIFSRSNTEALVGASAYVSENYPQLFLSDKLWQIEPMQDCELHMRWLAYWISSKGVRRQLSNLGTGTSGSMKNISKDELLSLRINLPPKLEQEKIASIVKTWDDAIASTEKLLANNRKQKQLLQQLLLSGQRRLERATTSNWSKRPISDLIVESRLLGSTGDIARKITVKLYGKGVISKEERRAGSDATKYYRRKAGQFIYSKLDFLNGAFGIVPAELDGFESTLDLPAFDFKDDVDPRWFLYHVAREEFYKEHLGLANGGRKARRVNPADFLQITIKVPPIEEQRAIADVIETAIAEAKAWEATVENLQNQKKALMADLLTGKRRVRIPEAEAQTTAVI